MICHNRHGIEVGNLPVAAGTLNEEKTRGREGPALFHGDYESL
jgi:hypothetical protein